MQQLDAPVRHAHDLDAHRAQLVDLLHVARRELGRLESRAPRPPHAAAGAARRR